MGAKEEQGNTMGSSQTSVTDKLKAKVNAVKNSMSKFWNKLQSSSDSARTAASNAIAAGYKHFNSLKDKVKTMEKEEDERQGQEAKTESKETAAEVLELADAQEKANASPSQEAVTAILKAGGGTG